MSHCCRHCGTPLVHEVIDLGHQPPSNAYLTAKELALPEMTYPLKVFVCTNCWLMQLPTHAPADQLFTADYAYFSSTSSSWCAHAKSFVIQAIDRLNLNPKSFVVELASNDGYLLQYMMESRIPCLGIEPTHATAEAARAKGIETLEEFFGVALAKKLPKADLIIANNVLAHVPDINDFLAGIACLLSLDGQASIEFPHLLKLLQGNQFDTIYHEHYSYLSLRTVQRMVQAIDLEIVDVEQLPTHGGSLRIWLAHRGNGAVADSVAHVLALEDAASLETCEAYVGFQHRAEKVKFSLLNFLLSAKQKGEYIVGYGAAAKGNTLLNYCGVSSDLLHRVVDRAESKQNKYLPGSHIPIAHPSWLINNTPDSLIVLPWNLIDEISRNYSKFNLWTFVPYARKYVKEEQ